MILEPTTLSFLTTYKCTAACDHCCFSCSPERDEFIPYDRMLSLIDEARAYPSFKLIVFTGGECFLLGDRLDRLIRHASERGLITRCVTNGYWATTYKAAESRVRRLKEAGLNEINFSTGPMHSAHVPVQRVIDAAVASLRAGFTTVINIELFNESDFDESCITNNPDLVSAGKISKLIVNRGVWIMKNGKQAITHSPEHSRFAEERQGGCTSILSGIAVTPDLDLLACCGFSFQAIPELTLGSVAKKTITEVLNEAPDDLLKIWLHVEGPEKILRFVKKYKPDYCLPTNAVHMCETCLRVYKDKAVREVLQSHYGEEQSRLMGLYMAEFAANLAWGTCNEAYTDSGQKADNPS